MTFKPFTYEAEAFFYPHQENKASKLFKKYCTQNYSLKDDQEYIALDLEMSGLDPVSDKIIQIAWIPIKFHQGNIKINHPLFSNIKVPNVKKNVLNLTKIKQIDLNQAPEIEKVLAKIDMQNTTFIGHHVVTDLEFLYFNLAKYQNDKLVPSKYLDSFYLSNQKLKNTVRNHKLITLEKHFKIEAPQHNAYADALASALIFYYLKYDIPLKKIKSVSISDKPANLYKKVLF